MQITHDALRFTIEKASQINPELEEVGLTLQAEVIEPNNSELEQIQVEDLALMQTLLSVMMMKEWSN